jgi:ribosome-binding ATPase YchF (GTP1/OBG family)
MPMSRAWEIPMGATAVEAAARIHTDISSGFICAEVIKPADYIQYGGEDGAKAAGAMKVEGKNYIVCDGDIIFFRHRGGSK